MSLISKGQACQISKPWVFSWRPYMNPNWPGRRKNAAVVGRNTFSKLPMMAETLKMWLTFWQKVDINFFINFTIHCVHINDIETVNHHFVINIIVFSKLVCFKATCASCKLDKLRDMFDCYSAGVHTEFVLFFCRNNYGEIQVLLLWFCIRSS